MRGFVYLILVGVMLTGVNLFGKMAVSSIGPFLLAFLRVSTGALLIAVFLSWRKETEVLRLKKGDLKLFLVGGLFGIALGMGFYLSALKELPVGTALFLDSAYPLWVAVLSLVVLKEKQGLRSALAGGFLLAGIFAIAGFSVSISGLGSLLALLAGMGYAVLIVMMRYIEQNKSYQFWDAVFWPFLLGAVFLVPFVLLEGSALPGPEAIVPIAGIIGCGFLAYVFWALGLRTTRAHNAPLIVILVEPLLTVALAAALFAEPVPGNIVMGGALILLANVVLEAHVRSQRLSRLRERLRWPGKPYRATP